MGQKLEKWGPLLISAIIMVLYNLFFFPNHFESIVKNLSTLLSTSSTLASVFLGFVGVIIGAVISLKDSKVIKKIEKVTAYVNLKRYIFSSFLLSFSTLIYSLFLMMFIPDTIEYFSENRYWISVLIFLFLWMIFSSIRMILILFELAEITPFDHQDKYDRWNEKKVKPKDL